MFNKWKIQTQLNIAVSLFVSVAFAAVAIINYNVVKTQVKLETESSIKAELLSSANLLRPTFESNLREAKLSSNQLAIEMEQQLEVLHSQNNSILEESLPNLYLNGTLLAGNFTHIDELTKKYNMPITIFQRTSDDDFIRISTSLKKENGERAYGTKLGKAKHPAYQKLLSGVDYYGMASLFGSNYVTAYIPLRIDSEKVNVIVFAGVRVTNTLASINEAISAFSNNSVVNMHLIDSKKKLLSTPPPPMDFSAIQDAINTGETGNLTINENNIYYQYVSGYDWTLIATVPIEEMAVMATILGEKTAMIAIVAIIFVIVALKILTTYVLQGFKQTTSALEQVGNGQVSNLALKYNADSKKETDLLMSVVDDMANKIYQLVCQVKENATLTDNTASHILIRSTEQERANSNVNEHIQSLAVAVEQLTASIADISERTTEAALASTTATQTSAAAVRTMHDLSDHINHTKENVDESVEAISKLSGSTSQITTVIEHINGIAEQTNLLALNAAIEAARAGEQGRGFAVVADEVRQLAQRTQVNVIDIKNVITELQKQTTNTFDSITNVTTAVVAVESSTSETLSQFTVVNKEIENVSGQLVSIATSTKEQSMVTKDIVEMEYSLKESMKVATEISAEILVSANGIKDQSQELKENVSVFN